MRLEYVPLLKKQRELYEIPLGWERFQSYLAEIIDPETKDIKLPLSGMNPMGKEHLPKLLDEYLSFGADELAKKTTAEIEKDLQDFSGKFRVTLMICDDLKGGWTNRFAAEFSQRFQSKPMFRRGWLTGILWSSETPSPEAVREEILTAIHRAAYISKNGFAETLGEMMRQEGYAMKKAGSHKILLDADDLEYTKEIIKPHLETTDYRTQMVCLFGDEAADSLGFKRIGLSFRAGLSLALHEAENNL